MKKVLALTCAIVALFATIASAQKAPKEAAIEKKILTFKQRIMLSPQKLWHLSAATKDSAGRFHREFSYIARSSKFVTMQIVADDTLQNNEAVTSIELRIEDIRYHWYKYKKNKPLDVKEVTTFSDEIMEDVPCPSLTLEGVVYKVAPCLIEDTIREGDPDKSFEIILTESDRKSYSYTVHGYGVGFPTYGIICNEASGGASWSTTIHGRFVNNIFHADGKVPRVYSGYLPIHIYLESENGRDNNYIKLPVTLTVLPKK